MPLGTSFNLGGATPFANAPKKPASPFMGGSTPAANALNMFSQPSIKTPTPVSAPDTGIKSHTTGADGSVKITYHAPDSGLTEQQARGNLDDYGKKNPGLINAGSPNLVGTTPRPENVSPASPGVLQIAPSAPYAPTDQSREAITYRDNNPVNNPQPGLIQNLLNMSQANPEVARTRQDLVNYKQAALDKEGAIAGTGADLAFKQGEQQVLQKTAEQGTIARQDAVANALAQQGLQQDAAYKAADLASPVSQFGVLTNPLTGQPLSGGSAGNAAFNGGAISGQQAAGQNYSGMVAANTAAKGIENSIGTYLQQNPNLNPSDLSFANSISQWVSGKQLGDPKYQTLANYLNEYISTLAPILGVGGDTTNLKTQIAQSFINAQASGQSISEVLQSISKLAEDKIANYKSGATGGGVVAGGNSVLTGGQQYTGYSGW